MSAGTRNPSVGRTGADPLLAVVARWVLGGVFISMGLSKAMHPVEFLKLVRQYDVLQHYVLLNIVTATLPWFEVFCGLLLLLGVAVRGAAAMLLVMLASFTVAVLLRALAIRETGGLPFCAIKFDCGCGSGEVLVCRKLGENLVLMIFSGALIIWRSHRGCLRYALF